MSYLEHLHEETLEAYVMGNLPEQEVNSLEDHLLLCEHCQFRTRGSRVGLEGEASRAPKGARASRFPACLSLELLGNHLRNPYEESGWALAGATLAIAAFLSIPSTQQANLVYRNVELSAMRGGDDPVTSVQYNERLRLHLDTAELDKLSAYHVVVVDASGDPVWEADQPSRGEGKLEVAVSKRLLPGSYWVRLMDTAENRRLLREYPLPVR